MNIKYFNKTTWFNIIATVLTSVNMCLIALGANPIVVNDNVLGVVASIIVMIVSVGYGVYKNNPTSPLGQFFVTAKKCGKKYGMVEVLEALLVALEDFANEKECVETEESEDLEEGEM